MAIRCGAICSGSIAGQIDMQQAIGEGRARDLHVVGEGEAQAEGLAHQPLVQPCGLFFRLLRRAFHHQTGAFQLNIQIFLTETGQRKGNAVVVIVAFFDVIGREALAFTGGLQGAGQFVKTNPLTQQGG